MRNAASNALLWQANAMDAQGHLTQQTYGNGIVTQQVFDAATGRLSQQLAGAGNAVQNMSYQYDSLGNLQQRVDGNSFLTETFAYDTLNRVTSATAMSGAVNVTSSFAYDALGNISSKSDVGAYIYNASGLNSVRPHAVASITGTVNGTLNPTFTYDANGNLVTGAGRSIIWSSFNIPSQIVNQTPNGAKTAAFWYNPEHERIKELQADQSIVITLSPRYDTGLHFEKKYLSANGVLTGAVEYEHYLYAGGLMFGKYITVTQTDGITLATTSIEYYSKDHLGSIVAITDGTGTVTQRLSYDVWGKRRYPNGAADPNGLLNNPDMYHGYTGHEMLDDVGLIHMNGRLYDPVMARFVSADFMIQSPDNLQSYNRYSYCVNNPLNLTDPSGQSFLGDLFSALLAPIASKNLRPFVAIGVTFIPGLNVYAAGFLSGMIGSGGDLKSGIIGALTAGAFSGLHGMDYGFDKILAHGMVGGVSNVLQGGDFKSGFMSSAFTQAASYGGLFDGIQSRAGNAIAAAIVGGTASVLGGGKFKNGAMTGAFSRMFNDLKVVITSNSAHAGMYITGAKAIYDPGGSYSVAPCMGCPDYRPTGELFTNNEADYNSYLEYQKSTSEHVTVYTVKTSLKFDRGLVSGMLDAGNTGVMGGLCANQVSAKLQSALPDLSWHITPSGLAKDLQSMKGVSVEKIK